MSLGKQTASIIAQNTGTEALRTSRVVNIVADFDSGSFSGTVTLQRRFIDKDINLQEVVGPFIDIETYTATVNKIANEVESPVEYRLFVKTGNYTSGTGELRLSY